VKGTETPRYRRKVVAQRARDLALRQLKAAHPEAWAALYAEERTREGLTKPARPRRSGG
jgi:hypothetical protein